LLVWRAYTHQFSGHTVASVESLHTPVFRAHCWLCGEPTHISVQHTLLLVWRAYTHQCSGHTV